jgi:Kef-type K+ transport system membrane component KefB
LLLSVPVFFLGLGYMLKLTIEHSPWWVTAGIVVSWLIVLLGLASLLDDLEQREPQKRPD